MSKKLIAGAGVVASLAVALAPLATFATVRDTSSDKHTDTLKVNVPASCAFGSVSANIVGVAHPTDATGTDGGKAAWNATTDDKQGLTPDRELNETEQAAKTAAEQASESWTDPRTRHDSADAMTSAYTIYAGTKEDNMAQTKLTVYCNDVNQDYTLTAKTNNLTHTDTTTTITPNASYSETVSGYALFSITAGENNEGAVVAGAASKFVSTSNNGDPIAKSGSTTDHKINAEGDEYTIQYGVGVGTSQKAGVYTGTVEYNLYQGVSGS